MRLNDPFDFAYTLAEAKQEAQPRGLLSGAFWRRAARRSSPLEQHVPVHLVYRTAFTQAKGKIQFRRDVYGRDAADLEARWNSAGVSLRAVRG